MKLKDLVKVLDQGTYVRVYIADNIPVGAGHLGNIYDTIKVLYEDYEVVQMYIDDSVSVYDACLVIVLWGQLWKDLI